MRRRSSFRRIAWVALLLAASLLAGCQGGPAPDSPSGVLRTALEKLAARDVAGLRAMACAGAEAGVLDQLGLPGDLSGEILPGVDMNAILDAVTLDTSALVLQDEVVTGDTATVDVRGDIRISFDAQRVKPLVKALLEAQGNPVTDEQLDALLVTLSRAAQELPVDQTVGLVREDGAWKLCSAS